MSIFLFGESAVMTGIVAAIEEDAIPKNELEIIARCSECYDWLQEELIEHEIKRRVKGIGPMPKNGEDRADFHERIRRRLSELNSSNASPLVKREVSREINEIIFNSHS